MPTAQWLITCPLPYLSFQIHNATIFFPICRTQITTKVKMASFVCQASSEKKGQSLILQCKWSFQRRRKRQQWVSFPSLSSKRSSADPALSASPMETVPMRSSQEMIHDVVIKQAALAREALQWNRRDSFSADLSTPANSNMLNVAYQRCGEVCAEHAKTFYLGTLLMTEERRRAIWAIYVWCRRTDELVDGPNSCHTTPTALDRWEKRLTDLFEGRPYDLFDLALSDTVARFPIDIQPFKDMIEGMRQDLNKSKYLSFDELYLYCYYVAGTVGLMSVPVMGIASNSKASVASIYNAALALGIANQLTNILRDVGEDASRGRIYLPQVELESAGLSENDIFEMKVTDKWRSFMKGQIWRARMYFNEAEKGIAGLDSASRWPVSASLMLYRQILDAIEENDYNNFTKRAYVGKVKKYFSLPVAYAATIFDHSNQINTART